MNEEWFGICAKGTTNEKGVYALYPRAAYYALKEVHKINPYANTDKSGKIKNTTISKSVAVLNAVSAEPTPLISSTIQFKRN